MELEEILNRTVKSIIALTSRSVVLLLIQVISYSLLIAFLNPQEIGVFIVVSAVLRIFTFFTDLGLGAALIQKKDNLTPNDLRSAFTIQTLLVTLVVLTALLITPLVRTYANLDPAGVFLYQVLAITLFISSLKMIPSILLERQLRFEKQIIPQIVESLVFNSLVVILAVKNFGIASYSWAILISSLIGLPIYYLVSPWKISLGISQDVAKNLIRFGIPFQGKSVLAIVKDDLLIFFLSGIVGASGIGFWGTAQKFAYYPFRLFVDTVTKVTFPAYSRIQKQEDALRIGIEKSLLTVSLLLFPVLTMIAILSRNLILLIPKYHQWLPSLPSLYFLCAGAAVSALSNILINALDATGRVKSTLALMVFWIASTWLLTLFFVTQLGFTGIAIASFLVSLTIVVTIYLLKRQIRFAFLPNINKPIIGCVLMGSAVFLITRGLSNNFFTVFLGAAVGAIIYTSAMFVLARKELLSDIGIVIKTFKKK